MWVSGSEPIGPSSTALSPLVLANLAFCHAVLVQLLDLILSWAVCADIKLKEGARYQYYDMKFNSIISWFYSENSALAKLYMVFFKVFHVYIVTP